MPQGCCISRKGGVILSINVVKSATAKIPPINTSKVNGFSTRGSNYYFTPLFRIGAVVQWLERFDYGAESRRKARVRGWALSCNDWKTLSVNQAVNGYLFQIRAG